MHKPKLSQCFLGDSSVAERMVEAAGVKEGEKVLEIGPGHGIITNEIIKKTSNVIVVEKDKELARKITKLFPGVTVITGDVLRVEFPKCNKIISNLPFEISSPLLTLLAKEKWETAILILQKEFADRFFYRPGEKKYSRLSIFMNYYFEVEKLETISKGNFSPQPKVDAVVVKLTKKIPKFKADKSFWDLVNALFRHKRKIVRGALKVEKEYKDRINRLGKLGEIRVNNLTLNNIREVWNVLS